MVPVGILTAAATNTGSFLLDLFPSSVGAYSLRKLRASYTGNCIRIRRANDNAEIDIGFVSNVLDTATISTFCGLNNGHVTVWYDQSGIGVNFIQTVSLFQPKIISGGVFYLQNGKPSINFDGSFNTLVRTGTMPLIERSFEIVGKQNVLQPDAGVISFKPQGAGNDFNSPDTFEFQTTNASNSSSYAIAGSTGVTYFLNKPGNGTQILQYGIYLESKTTTQGQLYENNTVVATDSSFTQFNAFNTQALNIGSRNFNSTTVGFYFNGIFQEFVYWGITNSSNITGINNNINSFYTIY